MAGEIRVRSRTINVLGGEVLNLRGHLLPATARRRVQLQSLRGGRWVTLAVARTGARGGFDLRYATGGLGQQPLRRAVRR